jgi:hypothetical protein
MNGPAFRRTIARKVLTGTFLFTLLSPWMLGAQSSMAGTAAGGDPLWTSRYKGRGTATTNRAQYPPLRTAR